MFGKCRLSTSFLWYCLSLCDQSIFFLRLFVCERKLFITIKLSVLIVKISLLSTKSQYDFINFLLDNYTEQNNITAGYSILYSDWEFRWGNFLAYHENTVRIDLKCIIPRLKYTFHVTQVGVLRLFRKIVYFSPLCRKLIETFSVNKGAHDLWRQV